MADAHSLLSFLGSTLDQPSSLPQTLSLLSLHAPFHPDVFHTVPAHSTTSFLKALDGLILSKDESNRLMGWSIGAVVIEQSRGSFEILDKYGRNWVVGLMSIVGKQLAHHLIRPFVDFLSSIFLSSSFSNPQFHRETTLPHLQKYTLNLLAWTEKAPSTLPLILPTLSQLVNLHPPSVRALHTSLLSASLSGLSTTHHASTRQAAIKLYTSLHLLPGKSASPQAFVQDLQAALTTSHESLDAIIQGVFEEQAGGRQGREDVGEQGIKWKGFGDLAKERDGLKRRLDGLERLDAAIRLVTGMLRQPTSRSVAVPVGTVLAVPYRILRITSDGLLSNPVSPVEFHLVNTFLPPLYILACGVLGQLALCVGQTLLPHQMEIVSYLIYLLEKTTAQSTLHQTLLQTLSIVLEKVGPLAPIHAISGSLMGRMVKVCLGDLGEVLEPSRVAAPLQTDGSSNGGAGKGKGKKRSHAESGSLSLTPTIPPLSPSTLPTALLSLKLLSMLLPHPALQPALHTLSTRVLLSIAINLPVSARRSAGGHLSAAWGQLESEVKEVLVDGLGNGPAAKEGTVGPEAGWIVQCLNEGGNEASLSALLHPLLPALPRSLPSPSSLLFFKQEGKTEETHRESLSLDTLSSALAPSDLPPTPAPAAAHLAIAEVAPVVPIPEIAMLSTPSVIAAPFESTFVQPSFAVAPAFPTHPTAPVPTQSDQIVPDHIAARDQAVERRVKEEERLKELARVGSFGNHQLEAEESDGEIPEIDMGDDTSDDE